MEYSPPQIAGREEPFHSAIREHLKGLRPMRGSPTGRSRSSSRWPNARASSYARVICAWPRAAIMVGRYTHAHQFKRARRQLKFLRTRLGRIIRDVRRKIEADAARQDRFGPLLDLALRIRHQEQRQRGPKVYSWHAPEVECIGRGKARTPYEFGCKVSIATPATRLLACHAV